MSPAARWRKAAGGSSRLAADERHLDLARFRRRGGADLGIAIGATLPDTRDRFGDRGLVGTGTKQRLQVVAALREEAREDLAVGGQPRARACGAERLRDRRDHADFAAPIEIAPALGHLTRVVRLDRSERELRRD